MTTTKRMDRRLDLAGGGYAVIEHDDFHPGQFRLTVGSGGDVKTVVLEKYEANRLSAMLLGALFDGDKA